MKYHTEYPRFNVLEYLIKVLPDELADAHSYIKLIFEAFTECGMSFEDGSELAAVMDTLEAIDFIKLDRQNNLISLHPYITENLFK